MAVFASKTGRTPERTAFVLDSCIHRGARRRRPRDSIVSGPGL